jgi:hypothetical protein
MRSTILGDRWNGDDDPRYARLVGGKTVAVVGFARTMLGQGRGPYIDGHDLVVRFNDAFVLPRTPELAADIGTRTDILYCNQVILRRARAAGFDGAGLEYVVCTNNSLSFTVDADTPSATRFRVVHAASEMLSRWLQGNWARTGLVGILDLLSFDVRRLFITGMTFYHGGGHLLMPESQEMHPRKNRDGTWAQSSSGQGHDSYLELDVMRRLAQEFSGVLETDEALSERLWAGGAGKAG